LHYLLADARIEQATRYGFSLMKEEDWRQRRLKKSRYFSRREIVEFDIGISSKATPSGLVEAHLTSSESELNKTP
jgi:hypothetical protein